MDHHVIRPLVWVQIAAGAAGAWWAGLDVAVRALLVMMALDYASGLGAAWIRRDLASRAAREGIVKKLLQLVLVLGARIAADVANVPGLADNIGTAFATAFIVAEFISIAENCANAGVSLPSPVVKAIRSLKPPADPS